MLDESYYTGITNNIEGRVWEHQNKVNPDSYTAKRLPVQLVFCTEFLYPEPAIAFEKQLKGWTRKKKEAVIAGEWNKLKELAVCKNLSSHQFFSEEQLRLRLSLS